MFVNSSFTIFLLTIFLPTNMLVVGPKFKQFVLVEAKKHFSSHDFSSRMEHKNRISAIFNVGCVDLAYVNDNFSLNYFLYCITTYESTSIFSRKLWVEAGDVILVSRFFFSRFSSYKSVGCGSRLHML